MAVYAYKGFDASGKEVKGIVDADHAKGARTKLRKQGVFPTEVAEHHEGAAKGSGLSVQIDFSKYFQRVSTNDLATMTSQLSTLVGAGIPMVEALGALQDQTENPKLRVALADIREKVNEGSTLGDALKSHPSIFGDLYVNMVAAGEASGSLDVVLARLTDYTEASVELKSKVTSAMIYPLLMTFIGGGIVLALFVFVIPRIRRVFDSFGASLPLITEALLAVSDFTLKWWWMGLIIVPGAVYGFRRWVKTEKGRERFDRFKLQIPIFGKINRLVAVSRFCRTLSTLLNSGVPILTALGITQKVVENAILARAVEDAAKNIREGQSIAEPLKASGEFPPIVTHMISIGEKTGELESMLQKVADAYDNWVSNMVNSLTSLLTPVLTVVMGGVVAIIAVAILLPMLNLSNIAR